MGGEVNPLSSDCTSCKNPTPRLHGPTTIRKGSSKNPHAKIQLPAYTVQQLSKKAHPKIQLPACTVQQLSKSRPHGAAPPTRTLFAFTTQRPPRFPPPMDTLRTPPPLPKLPKSPSSLFLLVLCFSPFLIMPSTAQPPPCTGGPTRPTTPLLSFLVRLQSEALKSLGPTDFDPKLYVDLPLKLPLSVTEVAFADLPRVNGSIPVPDLHRFVKDYFWEAGSDIVEDVPVDFVPEPEGFLPKVKNEKVRGWALEVHSLWKNLSRRVSDGVMEDPDLHTLLPLPEPMVVPGSRFWEVYYWDSYWVIRYF